MDMLPFRFPPLETGHVWLVGAGPGDPGLLSLLALHALQQADVVVHDALVDERVLALVGRGARLDYVGKRAGVPSPRQDEISRRLVALAREGLRVVRLKGGDPFLFGRGAMEALALAEAGIPFRVVPGITAGIGGLAYAGIPATARDANSAVAFITGHDASGDTPAELDWDAIARGVPVLVFYMALRRLDAVAERLLAAGRSPDEPAAIVSRASTAEQQVVETTLGAMAADARAAEVPTPALVVVGEVVRLRRQLDWHGAPVRST